jgi:hypothetical protein
MKRKNWYWFISVLGFILSVWSWIIPLPPFNIIGKFFLFIVGFILVVVAFTLNIIEKSKIKIDKQLNG